MFNFNHYVLPATVFLGMVGSITLIILWTLGNSKRRVYHYTALSEKLGLTLKIKETDFGVSNMTLKEPSLGGTYKGFPVVVAREKRGSGENRMIVTYIALELTPEDKKEMKDLKFILCRNSLLEKLLLSVKLFSGERIKFGDEEFDKTFVVKSKSENKFRSFLDASLRRTLIKANAAKHFDGDIIFRNGELRYEESGDMVNQERELRFEAMMDIMVLLAEKIRHFD